MARRIFLARSACTRWRAAQRADSDQPRRASRHHSSASEVLVTQRSHPLISAIESKLTSLHCTSVNRGGTSDTRERPTVGVRRGTRDVNVRLRRRSSFARRPDRVHWRRDPARIRHSNGSSGRQRRGAASASGLARPSWLTSVLLGSAASPGSRPVRRWSYSCSAVTGPSSARQGSGGSIPGPNVARGVDQDTNSRDRSVEGERHRRSPDRDRDGRQLAGAWGIHLTRLTTVRRHLR